METDTPDIEVRSKKVTSDVDEHGTEEVIIETAVADEEGGGPCEH